MLGRVVWLFAGTMAGNLVRFLFGVLLARQLGVVDFGLFSLAALFTLAVHTVMSMPASDAAVRFLATALAHQSRSDALRTLKILTTLVVPAGVASGIAVALGSEHIATVWFGKPELAHHLSALAWSIPFGALFLFTTGIMQAFEAFRMLTLIRNLAFPSMPLLLWIVIGGPSGGLDELLVAWNLSLALSAVMGIAACVWLYRQASWATGDSRSSARDHLAFLGPASLVGLLNVMQSWLDTLILGRLGSALQVGLYGAATRLAQPLAFATLSFSSVYSPRAARLHATYDRAGLRKLHNDTTRWMILSAAIPYLGLVLFGGELLNLFGPEFAPARWALTIYATTQFGITLTGPAWQLLMMSGHQSRVVTSTVLGMLSCALTAILCIPRLGASGAAVAFLMGMTAFAGTSVLQVARLHGIWPWTRHALWPIGIVAIAAPVAAAVPLVMAPVPRMAAGVIVLLVALCALVRLGLESSERESLWRWLRTRFD